MSIVSQGSILAMSNCKLGENQYIDQNKDKIYTVNHSKLEVVSVQDTEVELVPEVKQLVKHLSTEVQAYVDKYYKTPNGSQGYLDLIQFLLTFQSRG